MFTLDNWLILSKVQNEPGFIVGPIANFLGFILNYVFEFFYFLITDGAQTLGLSIIILTFITRLLMVPLAFKQHKSMVGMQRIAPEMEKIKQKYAGNKDPEAQRKMSQEMQALYSKEKVNPFSGCLPLLIQLPIFLALSYLMQNAYLYISKVGTIYNKLSDLILSIPNYASDFCVNVIVPIATPKVPGGVMVDLKNTLDLQKILNLMTTGEWQTVVSNAPAEIATQLTPLIESKFRVEHFMGINLIENAGLMWPGILIPILAVVTTFLSSYLMTKVSPSGSAAQSQKVMLFTMPLVMGFFTIGFPGGVGIYWIASSVFQVFQQIIMNKYVFAAKNPLKKEVGLNGKP